MQLGKDKSSKHTLKNETRHPHIGPDFKLEARLQHIAKCASFKKLDHCLLTEQATSLKLVL